MKTVRMSFALASLVGAATMLLVIPSSMAATPGMGWGVFYTGEGEPISSSYQRASATGAEGQAFDVFSMGDGVKIEDFQKAYTGTSLASGASAGWDVFRVGEGDPLP